MLGVLATQLVNTAVKGVFRRSRPALEELPHLVKVPTSLSFPSAHSSTSFAAARALSGLVPGRPLYVAAALMARSSSELMIMWKTRRRPFHAGISRAIPRAQATSAGLRTPSPGRFSTCV